MTAASATVAAPLVADRAATGVAVRRLAIAEAVRLVRHPAFLAGCGLTVAMFVVSGDEPNSLYLGLTGAAGMGPGLGLLVAVNMATLRARADDAEELLDAAPVDVADRTRALALATVVPAAAATVVALVAAAAIAASSGMPVAFTSGTRDAWPTVVELLQVPTFVAASGVLGLTLGRWCPSRLVSLAAGIALFFLLIPTFFWTADGWVGRLAPLRDHSEVSHWVQVDPGSGYNVVAGFDRPGLAWHSAYLVGIALVLAGVALARHAGAPALRRPLVAGAALVVIGSVAQGW
jgi:hypothetical protein